MGLQELWEQLEYSLTWWDSGKGPGLETLQFPNWHAVTAGLRVEMYIGVLLTNTAVEERCPHQQGDSLGQEEDTAELNRNSSGAVPGAGSSHL